MKLGNKLDHLTCEFQILLYLYLLPGISHTELKSLVDSSGTKLNSSLKCLTDRGMVYFTRHGEDKRRKLYYVSHPVSKTLDASHQEVFDWLDTTLKPRQSSLRAECR